MYLENFPHVAFRIILPFKRQQGYNFQFTTNIRIGWLFFNTVFMDDNIQHGRQGKLNEIKATCLEFSALVG